MFSSSDLKTKNRKSMSAMSTYSEETQELLKDMMNECKLTMLQRKRLQGYIDKGEPLPAILKPEQKQQTGRPGATLLFEVKHIRNGHKRTKLQITNMGAYEIEKVKPKLGVNKDVEKLKLQNFMAFGTEKVQHSHSIINKDGSTRSSSDDAKDRFEELVEEVRDRCQFLQDISDLGQSAKYKTIMENEIAAKIASMKVIDPVRCEEFRMQTKFPSTLRVSVKNKDITNY